MSKYQPGKWKAVCDVCGFEYYNDELRDRWDGYKVCRKDWEPRHPQEFVRGVPEATIPWSRPEPADVEITVSYVYTPDPVPDGTFDGEI